MATFSANCLLGLDGINVSSFAFEEDHMVIDLSSVSVYSQCPACSTPSAKVHSRYTRTILDLPVAGKTVEARFCVRKFFCLSTACQRKIFSERLEKIVKPYGRRTIRLDQRLTILGLKSGGSSGASIAMLFGIPVSCSTILRLACSAEEPELDIPRVLGIDDWAYKKGRNYGTILIDLERRQPVELLPDRESESIKKWLTEHPGVEIISRDRGGDYAKGASQGAPDAQQIADRWHLLKNLGDAMRRMMDKYNRELRQAAQQVAQSKGYDVENQQKETKSILDNLPLSDTPSRYELSFLEVKRLQAEGCHSLKSISRQTGVHRQTIKRYLKYETYPDRSLSRELPSSVDAYGDNIRKRWAEGEHNHVVLHEEIKALGYTGSKS
ncbi:MAG: ISL3 family transposase, partial [Bacteroidetes bacterium]|nr:ISL3 family transposase [Bacteroidota bacterium]